MVPRVVERQTPISPLRASGPIEPSRHRCQPLQELSSQFNIILIASSPLCFVPTTQNHSPSASLLGRDFRARIAISSKSPPSCSHPGSSSRLSLPYLPGVASRRCGSRLPGPCSGKISVVPQSSPAPEGSVPTPRSARLRRI